MLSDEPISLRKSNNYGKTSWLSTLKTNPHIHLPGKEILEVVQLLFTAGSKKVMGSIPVSVTIIYS